MKRRNFFLSLVATAFGAKAAPTGAYSTTVTSRTSEELIQAQLSQKHGSSARLDSDEWSRRVQALIVKRRRDPYAIHSFPFPASQDSL